MPRNKVTFFGVGDGWPCPDRNHSSTLYRLGETTLLVDCGEPISRSYTASKLDCNLVDHILLSHMHADHVGGFPMLMQGFWLRGRTKPLPVHLPREGMAALKRTLKTGYLFDGLLRFQLTFRSWIVGRKVKLGDVTATTHPTNHLSSLKAQFHKHHRQPFAAYSFLLETENARIAHSADLGVPEDLEPLLQKPVDLLVCELAHFTPQQIFRFLRGRPIKQVAFTHISDALWRKRGSLLREAKRALPGMRVSIPCDLEEMRV